MLYSQFPVAHPLPMEQCKNSGHFESTAMAKLFIEPNSHGILIKHNDHMFDSSNCEIFDLLC